MSISSSKSLPHGVNGVDLGEVAFIVANDKVILTSKGAREHLTLHLGPTSKVLDLHKTSIVAGGSPAHVTLFSITHASLASMMQELAQPIADALIGLARPLHPKRMVKRRIGAIVGLLPTGLARSAVIGVRRQTLTIDPKKLAARAWVPESLDKLYGLEDGEIFTLYLCPRGRMPHKIGYGFPVSDSRHKRRIIWIPDQRVAEAIERVGSLLQDAAARYGVFHTTAARQG